MEKIKQLKSYLNSTEVTDLKSDIDFNSVVEEAKYFLDKINKDGILELLNREQNEKLQSLIIKIEEYTKNYVANRINSLCLAINHFLSEAYDIFFVQIRNFEKRFVDSISENSTNISKLATEVAARTTEFNAAVKALDSTKEKSDQTVKNIEGQLKRALDIVNEWINSVKRDNDKQIDAKRFQIDLDITNYKRDVEGKFDELLRGFKDFKEEQIREFEKIDTRRKEFVAMYEIGVKYSKEARFDEYAMKEQKTANMFRWLSLGLMILVVAFIATLTLYNREKQDWNAILPRFLLVFSLMIPAVYTSRESSRHRRNSDKYAQMANELKAFEIAIRTEDMNSDIKDRIKEEIFKRYFGNIFANNSTDKNFSDDIGTIGRILKPVTKEKKDDGI